VHENSYKSKLYDLISASLAIGSTKTRIHICAGSIAGPSSISRQKCPAAILLLSSGDGGSCCKEWYPYFWSIIMHFLDSAESVPISRVQGSRGEKSGTCIQGFHSFPICQSCIPAGILAIYITDGEIESFHGELTDFFLHTFILHKPLIFTTSH
jgi:hypothetical protein